ncbi:MAG: hypothetical protein JWP14_1568 [Frankiales bacterium]|nr:hypothetical protein [Frankiales bacterium]
MEKLTLHSPDLSERNIDKLAALFPTVVTETLDGGGRPIRAIDYDLLRQELSGYVVEGPQERYQLDWPGKRAALLAANAPIAKTLRPVREASIAFDTAKNLFIEGDNLDALKLLQESYLGAIKLIYIDPPYNTGNDFIYDDDFAESTSDYLARSGQVDEGGVRLVANTESNGRFHSDWLSMMYPRLKLARNLLKHDGLIMISIDENEVSNLASLCDEVFGQSNRVGMFVWERKKKPSFLRKTMGVVTEYVVAYARDYEEVGPLVAGSGEEGKKYPINNAGNAFGRLTFPAGTVSFSLRDGIVPAQDMSEGNIRTRLVEPVTISGGRNVEQLVLEGEWRYSQRKLDELIADGGEIRISKVPFRPNYINRKDRVKKTANLLSHRVNGVPTNEDATAEIRSIFGADVMDFPKPVGLLKYLFATCTEDEDIVLDFFAGSATTGQAVAALNADDGGARRFMLIQLDEGTPPGSPARESGFETVAALGRERLRRVGRDGSVGSIDFRALKVDTTNLADVLRTPDSLEQGELKLYTASIKPNRSGEDLLFQVLLDWGLDFTMPMAVEVIDGHEVFVVEDDALIACFADGFSDEVVKTIAMRQPLRAVFRDSGFATDADRVNAEQIFAERSPTTDVKTI